LYWVGPAVTRSTRPQAFDEGKLRIEEENPMNEMMFGSGSPVWTGMPSVGLTFQPLGIGNPAMGTSMFNTPLISSGIGGGSGAQGLSASNPVPIGMYGYGGAATPIAQQNLPGPGVGMGYGLASNPQGSWIGSDISGFVTAPALLAAVALRRGQPQGPTNDQEVEEFIYDALDLLPGAVDVDVRVENGRATLTGHVQHKRTKRDAGEIAWSIPSMNDVQNNVSITSRRRARAAEATPSVSPRKQA
jgi:hypothetical protein